MNVLFVAPYTPTRIRTRPYNLIQGLLRRGHALTLATLWESDEQREALRVLEQEGIRVISSHLTKARSIWNSLLALPTSAPLQSVYCRQPHLSSQISGLASQFDVVHIEHLRGVLYALQVTQSPRHPPVVWDSVDCISYLFEQAVQSSRSFFGRSITRIDLARTRRYEGWLAGQFNRVLVTSPVDKNALERLASKHAKDSTIEGRLPETICVLPNGVDLDYFTPTGHARESDTLVLSGKMSYHANVTAALHLVDDVMPLIWAKRSNIRVWIAGKDPPAAVRRLATRNPQRVMVTGTVPDIRPYLARATVAVCPVNYGAGIQNKVLEAMAMGTPVVASPQAVSALEVRDGEHLLVADGPESFAQAVLKLLEKEALRERIRCAGRKYVDEHHDWGMVARRLEEIYEEVVSGQRSHAASEALGSYN